MKNCRPFFCKIEILNFVVLNIVVLNSRPISFLCGDPKGELLLTRADLCLRSKMEALPSTVELSQVSVSHCNSKKRWACIQAKLTYLWNRWSKEYFATLHQRSKWRNEVPNLKLGDLVYITDDNVPPLQLPLGRVKQLYVGRNSIVRVAKVKTGSGENDRAVHKLRKLTLPSYRLEIRLTCIEEIEAGQMFNT